MAFASGTSGAFIAGTAFIMTADSIFRCGFCQIRYPRGERGGFFAHDAHGRSRSMAHDVQRPRSGTASLQQRELFRLFELYCIQEKHKTLPVRAETTPPGAK